MKEVFILNFDLTMKVVMAVAGVIGGIAQAYMNGKTLVNMAKGIDSEETKTEGTEVKGEEV